MIGARKICIDVAFNNVFNREDMFLAELFWIWPWLWYLLLFLPFQQQLDQLV